MSSFTPKPEDPNRAANADGEAIDSGEPGNGEIGDREIASLAAGTLSGAEREFALRRLVRSPEAARKYRNLIDLQTADTRAAPGAASYERPVGLLATAFVALCIAVIVPVVTDNANEPGDSLRSPVSADVSPVDGSTLSAVPLQFRWPAHPAALSYRVRLFDSQAFLLWQSDWVQAAELSVADDALAAVVPHGELVFWVVEISGSAPQSELGPYWFKVETVL